MRTPVLNTERLILRPMTVADAPDVYKNWASDEDVTKYMRFSTHSGVEVAEEWLNFEEKLNDAHNRFNWGFVRKSDGVLFGSGGLNYNDEHDCFEIGYVMMKSAWGKGYATEASMKMLEFAKDVLKVEKLYCCHAVENVASENVILKLGFAFSGYGTYEKLDKSKTYDSKNYYLEFAK